MRRMISAVIGAALLVVAMASTALAGGPPAPGIYVDGQLYRTVGTPTDFSNTGAPDSSYDTIWSFGGVVPSVADAKPGDRDFNGGRWMVYAANFADGVTPYEITSDTDLWTAVDAGDVLISEDVVKMFECPLIAIAGHRN